MQAIKNFLGGEESVKGFPSRSDFFSDYRIAEIENFTKQYCLSGEQVLILVKQRERAAHIVDVLKKQGLKCEALWGGSSAGGVKGMSRKQKDEAMNRFGSGRTNILVATEDVLGLGVTLNVDHLLIDALPLNPQTFVQELGRVARTKDGNAYYLIGSHPCEKNIEYVLTYTVEQMKKSLKKFPQ
jgi:ERCC4-related helicase